MDLPRYEYEPLKGSDEIRVLEITATKTRIETCIVHVPVSSRSHQALSYVWGKPDPANKAIVVDELGRAVGWVPLTKNLGNALCDLRDAEDLKSKVFWIDQICINQRDDNEKNHQVAMMSQIYTQASRVITYLGPAASEEEEQRGLRLLNKICENISDSTWHRMYEAGGIARVQDFILDGSIQLDHLPSDLDLIVHDSHHDNEISKRYVEQGWEWLIRVAYGEWTRRLWIVQEQVLNKEITTLRGHKLIDWNSVVAIPILFAIDHLPRQYRDTGRRDLGEDLLSWDDVEGNLFGTWWERYARLTPGTSYTGSPLAENLVWYQSLLCEDPRDQVYANLAISQDSEKLGLKPDYSTLNTTDALSKQLSIRVLEKTDTLELLVFTISRYHPNSRLPSWCFNINRPANIRVADTISHNMYAPHPKTRGLHLVRFSMNDSILVVKGRIVDHISTPSSGITWSCHNTENVPRIQFLSSLLHLLPDGFSIQDIVSLFRTVAANGSWSSPAPAQHNENITMAFHFWAYLRHWSSWLAARAGNLTATTKDLNARCDHIATEIIAVALGVAHPERQSTYSTTREEDTAFKMVSQCALEHGRCLGRTRTGRFYNAMQTSQEGDAIVAIQGADRLFTIRPVGNTYKLIGDVFVDGLMHGEAYENQEPENVDYDIELS